MSATVRLFRGTVRILSAELLAIPCTILILAVLTRALGPADFGHFALAVAVISCVEWTLNTFFGKATIKLVGEEREWLQPAGAIIQFYSITAILVAILLIFCSRILAGILNEPVLTGYLRLFALDIPIWSTAQGHRSILVARESFRKRSWLSVARWIGRVLFTIPLVLLFPSVEAAICGWILSSVLEVAVARILISLPFGFRVSLPTIKRLLVYAAPLAIFGLILRFYDKLDLFFLKILGATAREAGIYGAAQNFSFGVAILSVALSTPLLGTLTRLVAEANEKEISRVVASTLRVVLLLVPFLALASAASPEIVDLIFGKDYTATGPIMRILLFSALLMVITSISASILIAYGRPRLTLILSLPMLPLAISGYLLLIPVYGATGAATVSLTVSALSAIASTILVHSIRPIQVSLFSPARSISIGAFAWWMGETWNNEGFFVLTKLSVCGILIAALFLFTGEFKKSDLDFVKTFLIRKKEPRPVSV